MLDLHGYIDFILSNSALKGLSLIVLSIVSAKFVDMVFTFIFKRLVSSTKTTLDDMYQISNSRNSDTNFGESVFSCIRADYCE